MDKSTMDSKQKPPSIVQRRGLTIRSKLLSGFFLMFLLVGAAGFVGMGFSVAAAGLVLLIGVLFSLSISTRLGRLREVVSRIEKGDLAGRAQVGARDEIGALAESVNAMLNRIQENIRRQEEAEKELSSRAEEVNRTSSELETFNQLAVGREQRIIELKKRVNELSEKMGNPLPYDLSFIEGKAQRALGEEEVSGS